jgi:hypothetical protein
LCGAIIRHVVCVDFLPSATAEQRAALEAGLSELPSLIPEIVSFTFGSDLGLATGTSSFAIVADFDDAAAYGAYSSHPSHLALVETLFRPIAASVHRCQIDLRQL